MTKRFTHQPNYDGIRGEEFYDNRKRMRYDEVCDKLNEQKERITELEEENEQLKQENEELKKAIIDKIIYEKDLESFAIIKGLIDHDWSKTDD